MTRWTKTTIGEACEIYQPKMLSAKDASQTGEYPVYGANGIIATHNEYNHEKSELTIGCRGSCGFVNLTRPKSWITSNAMVVRPKIDEISVRFLEYLFRGGVDIKSSITGTAQPQITRRSLSPIEFSYPPLAIQKAIVAKLDAAFASIDTAIAAAEKNAENAKQLFQSYLSDVFEKGGEGWEEMKLVEICTINPSKKEVKTHPADMLVSFMPMEDLGIATQNAVPVHERPIGDLIKSYTYFRDNEVLLAKITPCFENGKLGIAKKLVNGIGFGSSEYIVFRPNKELMPDYLYYFLERDEFRALGASHMSGAVGHKRVSKEFIENSRIAVPPIQLQKSLVGKLNAIFYETKMLIETYRKRTIALRSLKQSLLQQAFSGQLVDA